MMESNNRDEVEVSDLCLLKGPNPKEETEPFKKKNRGRLGGQGTHRLVSGFVFGVPNDRVGSSVKETTR